MSLSIMILAIAGVLGCGLLGGILILVVWVLWRERHDRRPPDDAG